jgi:hypothetical protein
MTLEEKKFSILDICTEDETFSSNFWDQSPKTVDEGELIVEAISQLVADRMLITFKHRWNDPEPSIEISYDRSRLTYEVMNSRQLDHDNYDEIRDSYMSFYATEAGKEEYKRLYSLLKIKPY